MVGIRLVRLSVLVAAVLALASGAAQAQLARPRVADPNAPKLLVVPFWYENSDSALALLVADGLRERLRNAHLTRFNTISRQNLNENLLASGYPTDVPMDAATVRQLARHVNARFVVEGYVRARGDSMFVSARMYETAGRVPQSASADAATSRQRVGSGTGADVANRLVQAFESFDDVNRCVQSLDQDNFVRARQQAQNALRQFPNSASAYLCIAQIMEQTNGSPDSILWALREAFRRDTVNTIVMRRLAQKLQTTPDTNGLIDILQRILAVDTRDNELRIGTAQLFVQMNRAEAALAIIDSGLRHNPASLELLKGKSVALAALQRWADAASTLQQVGEIDSTQVDSAFVFRITNYYKNVPDSAGLFRWTQVATQRFPDNALYWYDLSTLAISRADTNLSLEAARQYLRLRPEDARGHALLARPMMARGEVDSGLVHAEAAAADSALRPFAGFLYMQAGLRALQDSTLPSRFELAAARLQKAKDWIPESARQQYLLSAYYLGVAQIQLAVAADRAAEEARSCDGVRTNMQLVDQVEQNIIAGAAQDRQQANTFLTQYIPSLRQRADAFLRNWRCPPPTATTPPR